MELYKSVTKYAMHALIGGCMTLFVGAAHAAGALERIQSQGYIRVGFSNETPFAFAQPDGTLAGVDIEILQKIVNELNVPELDGGLTKFSSLIPGLIANRFDLITSAIYIKPDRCAQVAFGEPMYLVTDAVVVPAGNPKNIHSFIDVAGDPDFKLGMPAGGTGMSDKAAALGVKQEQFVLFQDLPSGFAALQSGRIDGYLTTGMTAETQLRAMNNPRLERAVPFEQPVIDGKIAYGVVSFALRKEDQDLLQQINQKLLKIRGTPQYVEILVKYGMSAADLPTDETTEKICAQK